MRKYLVVAVIGVGVGVAGCAMNGHSIRPLRPKELATSAYVDRTPEALVGSLQYEGGCLLFRDDATRARLLPVWPTGSVFNGTSVTFHQPAKDDQRIIVGEEIVMEGQSADWQSLGSPAYQPFRHQCIAAPFFVSRVHPAD